MAAARARYVAFSSSADNLATKGASGRGRTLDAFVSDTQTGVTRLASMDSDGRPGDDSSWASGISANGRWVLMLSLASNLVRHDTNRVEDAFIRDVRTRTTTRVSVSHTEEQADNLTEEASISRDGRYVAFTSYADDLDPHVDDLDDSPDVFFRDVKKGWTRLVSASLEREPGGLGDRRRRDRHRRHGRGGRGLHGDRRLAGSRPR